VKGHDFSRAAMLGSTVEERPFRAAYVVRENPGLSAPEQTTGGHADEKRILPAGAYRSLGEVLGKEVLNAVKGDHAVRECRSSLPGVDVKINRARIACHSSAQTTRVISLHGTNLA
jgi:hypothetical protein